MSKILISKKAALDVALEPPVINAITARRSHVVAAEVGTHIVPLLVDCGSDVSAIRRDVVQELGLIYTPADPAIRSASGHRIDVVGEVALILRLGDLTFRHDFAVVDVQNTSWFGLIGTDFLARYQGDIIISQQRLSFPQGSLPLVPRTPLDCVTRLADPSTSRPAVATVPPGGLRAPDQPSSSNLLSVQEDGGMGFGPSHSNAAPPSPPPQPRDVECTASHTPLVHRPADDVSALKSLPPEPANQTQPSEHEDVSAPPGAADLGLPSSSTHAQEEPLETLQPPQLDPEPRCNRVTLDRPLKLSPKSHTMFHVQTDWAKGQTLSLTLPTDDHHDVGITPCVVSSNQSGRTPVLFYNNTDRNLTLQPGELDFITAEICVVESEWLKTENQKRSEYVCSCNSTGTRALKEAPTCLVCSKSVMQGDPLLWPEDPEPAKTDEEFLALFALGEDHFNSHKELKELLVEFKDIFIWGENSLGRTPLAECDIDTGNAAPIARKPYRVPLEHRKTVENAIKDMLARGVIKPSNSPWASPLLVVPKRDPTGHIKSWRPVIDYRLLNDVTRKKRYPFRTVQEIFDTMGPVGPISSLDFESGYWQVPMTARASNRAAFTCHVGHYEPLVMAFGLSNAPAEFVELGDKVFKGLLGKGVQLFIDDVLVTGVTPAASLSKLREVFLRIRDSWLRLKPSKCFFMQREVAFLGHILDSKGTRPNPGKVQAIRARPKPTTLKGLRSFLGAVNYYRRYCPGFAGTAAPLTDLTRGGGRSNQPIAWTPEAHEAYGSIVDMLTSPPCLHLVQEGARYHLTTDASAVALGAVLEVENEDGTRAPVGYYSYRLKGAQTRYGATQLEALAVVEAVQFFRTYLLGRHFVLHTDNMALLWLLRQKEPKPMFARWVLILSEFSFDVVHVKGRLNALADMLSRPDLDDAPGIGPQDLPAINIIAPMARDVSYEKIKERQFLDPHLMTIRDVLLSGQFHEHYEYFLDNRELVYRMTSAGAQLCVPASMVQDVLFNMHQTLSGGHAGVEKTLGAIKERYYWPTMVLDVRRYVTNCIRCIKRKGAPDTGPGPQLGKASPQFMDIVFLDVVGPLPISATGNRFILTMLEGFTRFPEAVALPEVTAPTVAKAFVNTFVLRYGLPRAILTDFGSNFCSKTFTAMCALLRIKPVHCSPFRPMTNLTEPMHKPLVDFISLFIASRGTEEPWDDCLPFALMSLRSHKHSSLDTSPSTMLFGRGITLPGDLDLAPQLSQPPLPPSGEEYMASLRDHLESVRNAGHLHDLATREKTLERAKQSTRPEVHIADGDLVLIKSMGHRLKFDDRMRGPYRVLRHHGLTYFLEELNSRTGKPRVFPFHRALLRRVQGVPDFEPSSSDEPRSPSQPTVQSGPAGNTLPTAGPVVQSVPAGATPNRTRIARTETHTPPAHADAVPTEGPSSAVPESVPPPAGPLSAPSNRGRRRGRPLGRAAPRRPRPRINHWAGVYHLRERAGADGPAGHRQA